VTNSKEPLLHFGGRRLDGVVVSGNRGQPLVSLVTVVFNDASGLRDTLQSVLKQTYPNLEHVVIDGGSSDGTLEILVQNSHSIDYWTSELDRGIYDAMNKGIRASSGSLIGIVNAGDWLASDAVDRVVAASLDGAVGAEIISGGMTRVDAEGRHLFTVTRSPTDLARRCRYMPVNHGATFVPRAVFERCGLYDEHLRIAGDWEFILRVMDDGVAIRLLPDVLSFMKEGGVSDREFLKWRATRERYAIRRRYCGSSMAGILGASEYFRSAVKSLLPKKLLHLFWAKRWGAAEYD
jgi:glycosyltransferase involved in cell wall biosynthesis